MKVLTAAQMREVDARTVAAGIPEVVLMENAGSRVVEFLQERFAPLSEQKIVVVCGKGNNGGDGFVIARQLLTRFAPKKLEVVAMSSDSEPARMFVAAGGTIASAVSDDMRDATLVIDAVLGTGLKGPAHGPALDLIRAINTRFAEAKIVAVDLPSGMNSDLGTTDGEIARADGTVTFTAPRIAHVLEPNCAHLGEFRVAPIGTPAAWLEEDQFWFSLSEPAIFRHLFYPRVPDSNKGMYGHVLVVGGAHGKYGAPTMSSTAALRIGAGLVTAASEGLASPTPELMTAPLPQKFEDLQKLAEKKTIAIGPGLGSDPAMVTLVRRAFAELEEPMVVDADGLNALAGTEFQANGKLRILTPHPGEMGRLATMETKAVQGDRLELARRFAQKRGVILVLKGNRTLIASPDGKVWVNPTGSPALAKGGTGDLLTGFVAGLLAQFPKEPVPATLAAVYLHGLAGQIGARRWTEQGLLATDLLQFLPEAIRDVVSH